MNIWLCNPYGPLPGEAWRETRYAMLGRVLARRGHNVTWWTAGFSHHSKKLRSAVAQGVVIEPRFNVQLIPTPCYKRHVGFGRLRFEFFFGLRLYRIGKSSDRPDVIVSADATMAWTHAALLLARRFRCQIVYDIIDLYPEVFSGVLPGFFRPHARKIFAPLYALRNLHLKSASAVTAVCDDYLLPARGVRPSIPESKMLTVFWSTDLDSFHRAEGNSTEIVELSRSHHKQEDDVFAIYAGTLGLLYDIEALLEAARLLRDNQHLKILIAGGGPRSTYIREFVTKHSLDNIRILGEIGFTELIRLYQMCDIGLSLYGVHSPVAMPIKVFDYFAAGLPIVNSIKGFLEQFLRERQIGVQYSAGDAKSLAAALEKLTSNASIRREMAKRTRDVAGEFDSDLQYGRFASLLEHLHVPPLHMVSP